MMNFLTWIGIGSRRSRCNEFQGSFSGALSDYLLQRNPSDIHIEESPDPFALTSNELSTLTDKLHADIVSEVPKLASAAGYFFKMGVEGKMIRPTILLLMASAINMPVAAMGGEKLDSKEIRERQHIVAETTEMIHVASLLLDDVIDQAETRRGIGSLNSVMGNKVAVLAGDFLICKASRALTTLNNIEVLKLLHISLEDLVKGEIMQMSASSEQIYSMEYYLQKTYCKTASLISNGCKSVAIVAGQPEDVSKLAYDFGRNLGLAYQLIDDVLDFTGSTSSLGKDPFSDIQNGIITAPLLFALEEYPQLRAIIDQGFGDLNNVEAALEYLAKSEGIQKTMELAIKHANLAAEAIKSLPESEDEQVLVSRLALVNLAYRLINRTK